MTRDNVTGLVWELKTNANKNDRYNWQDAQDEFISSLNTAQFGGFSDWRMPDVTELSSLVNAAGEPWIDASLFPKNVSRVYWSSTTNAYYLLTSNAWFVNFYDGLVSSNCKSNTYYVRAVRSGQSGLRSFDDLIIHGDGTFSDPTTGLMWQLETAPGSYTWENALQYAEDLQLASYTDWRLPDRNELKSLVDYHNRTPTVASTLIDNTVSSGYWSSTTVALGTSFIAWRVHFGSGGVGSNYKSSTYYVRAVRLGHSSIDAFGSLAVNSTGASSVPITTNPSIYNGTTNYIHTNIPHGTQITLTAPATSGGESFTSWSGCDSTSAADRTCSVTMDGDKTVTVDYSTSTRIIRLTGDLSFGSVAVGQSATRTLIIHNDGNSTLNVTGINYPSGFSGSWNGNISAGGSRNVTVTFSPTEAKSYGGTITVNSNKTSGTDTIGCSGIGASATYGSLRVTIEPADARNAGAKWRRVGTSTWRSSGYTESNVPTGTQRVEFSDIDGWRKPSSQSVTIRQGQTTVIEQTYTEQQGTALPGVMMLLLDEE